MSASGQDPVAAVNPRVSPGRPCLFSADVVINSARSLILGDTATEQQRTLLLGGSTSTLVVQAQLWTVGIGLVFGLLCTRKYRSLSA